MNTFLVTKKKLALCLAALTLTLPAQAITTADYAKLFKGYDACFILYNVNDHKIISEYNPNNRCNQRLAPDSTFKIALSLMAFNQGTINQNTEFKWDGHKGVLPEHDRNQTPASWLKYSVLWVSQQITPQLGEARIKHYLAGFAYGNQDFSGDKNKHNGLTHAWLSSSLKLSGFEQLNFLKAMLTNELPVNANAVKYTKENLYLGKLANGADYYGKTGSGRHGRNERYAHPSQLRDGWFVGFIEQGKQQYIFVSNLTDKQVQATIDPADGSLKPFGSQLLKPITMNILNTLLKPKV
ncbi:class-D beta-lactamase [Legionella beliardensis]|uniref:Beta-lactamase n=1 Tax=Legionella beliardensis TaxID=91822 RepID=A0A378I1P0_9GAMM|nr:penicillin-binding transpeptidase domain-containing protein [Legionella beliardensis]STX28862.1 class-D beta-lactamase [Legionella beliardensis]